MTSRAAVASAYGAGALIVLGLGLTLLAIPIQVSDSFGNMLKLSTPWPQFVVQEFTQPSYLRPFLWMQLKAVYDLSGGHFFWWFRGFHVLQVVVLVWLYLQLVRPRTWRDAAAVPLGLAVLVGHHAFAGTVNEAFPINAFLTVVICCLAAAALALGTPRRGNALLAVALCVYAALSVESGLLVFVVFAVAAFTGGRGVPRQGLLALAVALVGYFALRFAVLDVGSPALSERSSGFGFAVLDPSELARRFSDRRLAFYAYNVVASALSVVFGEPRGGVFRLVDGFRLGAPYPSLLATAAASTAASALIGVFAWRRLGAWRARQFTHDDRLVLLFFAVLPANAAISFPYTKDVIMSPAAAFMALAACVAARDLLIPLAGWGTAGPGPGGVRAAVGHVVDSAVVTSCRDEGGAAQGPRGMGLRGRLDCVAAAGRQRRARARAARLLAQRRADGARPTRRTGLGPAEVAVLRSPDVFGAALATPIVAAACFVLVVEAAEWRGRAWWDDARPRNAAEASAFGRAADVVRLVQRGDHPEQIFPVRAGMIRESPGWLSAVEGAMWAEGPAMIRLVEHEGAVLTDVKRRQLACLARDLGQPGTADYLMPADPSPCAPGAALAAVRARTGPS